MKNALLVQNGTWILCLAATTLMGCSESESESESGSGGSSSSSSSSSGRIESSSSSSSSGDSAMCEHTATGMATPFEIVLRNTGSTDLYYSTQCGNPWLILAPNGGSAPSRGSTMLCDQVSGEACRRYDCHGYTYAPVPAGTDAKFTWDGVVYESVDAVVNGCPVADLGTFCGLDLTCDRRVDAPPGTYTLVVDVSRHSPNVKTNITKTVEFMYPEQTKIEIVFP
jgi:hypothetical protein